MVEVENGFQSSQNRRLLLQGDCKTEADKKKIEKRKNSFKTLIDASETQIKKFKRHQPLNISTEKNLRRRRHLDVQQKLNDEAVKRLALFDNLLTECQGYLETEPHEKSFALKQKDILDQVDIGTKAKAINLQLPGGPFSLDFTQNGRYLLSGGHTHGSLSIIDCLTLNVLCETHVNETIRDVCFLQNETMWAAAQKKYVHIYDGNGLELHCLREHMRTYQLEFLPHHYLLTTIGEFGELRYLDISTGLVAACHKTKKGPCHTMCQNPFTAVIALGHTKGAVSMWTPNVGKPVVEFLAHGGRVTALRYIDANYLGTSGMDGTWKVWDVRKFQHVNSFRYFGSAPKAMDSCQNGTIVGVGFGCHVQFWKDPTLPQQTTMPYLTHNVPGNHVECLKFRPYEDFCYLGLGSGIQSVVVPGSGLANFHSHTADPYETVKQRQEKEVHTLLDKLPSETITYDPSVLGLMDVAPPAVLCQEEDAKQLKLKEEKEKKMKRRSLRKQNAIQRERTQRKMYTELVRKKAQRRLREEALGLIKPNDADDTNAHSGVKTKTQCPGSVGETSEPFDALQRFRKKKQ